MAKTVLSRVGLLGLAVAIAIVACGGGQVGSENFSSSAQKGSTVEGKASWYGGRFHGRKTASGETFDKHAFTAAHRKLPFGTTVRVTALKSGRVVTVRINDRGPFGNRGRIVDLSEAAAEAIGMKQAGVIVVHLEVLKVGAGRKRRKRSRTRKKRKR